MITGPKQIQVFNQKSLKALFDATKKSAIAGIENYHIESFRRSETLDIANNIAQNHKLGLINPDFVNKRIASLGLLPMNMSPLK